MFPAFLIFMPTPSSWEDVRKNQMPEVPVQWLFQQEYNKGELACILEVDFVVLRHMLTFPALFFIVICYMLMGFTGLDCTEVFGELWAESVIGGELGLRR